MANIDRIVSVKLDYEPMLKRGYRLSHGFPVHWRKDKRRKRKLLLLNKAAYKAAGGNWRIAKCAV